jgi:acetyl esterase/lipase
MTLTAWLAFAAVAAAQGPKAPDDVGFEADIVYGKGGGEDLKLNLSRPKNATGPLPCVLVIHGGAWAAGDRALHNNITWLFAQRGYVAVTVGYRLAPKHLMPAGIEDVKCAVRFLRAHAEKYGLDPKRVGATGFSAGGHLSMILGVMGKEDGLEGDGGWADQDSQVQAVVSFFGPTDLLAPDIPKQSLELLKRAFGGSGEEKKDLYVKASPITYVTKGDAPMLLLQGTKDLLVPHTQATIMLDKMTAAGVKGRIELLAGAGHGWPEPELGRTMEVTIGFFDLWLKKK